MSIMSNHILHIYGTKILYSTQNNKNTLKYFIQHKIIKMYISIYMYIK